MTLTVQFFLVRACSGGGRSDSPDSWRNFRGSWFVRVLLEFREGFRVRILSFVSL